MCDTYQKCLKCGQIDQKLMSRFSHKTQTYPGVRQTESSHYALTFMSEAGQTQKRREVMCNLHIIIFLLHSDAEKVPKLCVQNSTRMQEMEVIICLTDCTN